MAAPTVRAVTTANESSAGITSLSLGKPTGTTSGDFLVMIVADESRAGETDITAPSGFTQAGAWASASTSGTIPAIAAFTKVAGSSEPSSYSLGVNGNNTATTAVLLSITGASGVDVNPVASTSTTAATAQVAPSVTPVSTTALLLCAVFEDSSSARTYTVPSGMTSQATVSGTTQYVQGMVASLALTSNAATGTKTFTSSASSAFQAISLTIAPTVSVTLYPGQFFGFFGGFS